LALKLLLKQTRKREVFANLKMNLGSLLILICGQWRAFSVM